MRHIHSQGNNTNSIQIRLELPSRRKRRAEMVLDRVSSPETIRASDEGHRIGLSWRSACQNCVDCSGIVGRFASGLLEEQSPHLLRISSRERI